MPTNLPYAASSATYNAGNRQTASGGQSLTYDLNGNLTGDGVNTYTWDSRDQLTSVSGTGFSASFQYDSAGRRTSKSINGTTVGFLYDGVNIVQEQSGGNASANIVGAGIDQFFSRSDASGTSVPLVDVLGSAVAISDSTGAVQTEYTYDPFGNTSTSGTISNNNSQYTSRENDGIGLYYYRARYYSPLMQRFISEDPISLDGGDSNFFAYAGNDPIGFVDPLGLEKNGGGWGRRVVQFWFEVADIRSAQQFWEDFSANQIKSGNWVGATVGDLCNVLITGSELPEVQRDGEILGSDASVGRKALASVDLVRIGVSWFYVITGSEIVPEDPKKCRIAPAGNRAWRWGYEKPGVNQLPHYHFKRPGPGGSYKWHRPWQKGF